jgi:hypothetical protein
MGSHSSGEGLVAGEDNFANKITLIVASRSDGGGNFDGTGAGAILLVTPDGVVGQRPDRTTDGVTGYGWLGGAGIRGLGCQLEGPHGWGWGAGTGGEGVISHGGSGDLDGNAYSSAKTYNPGAGVIGVGGIWTGPQHASNPRSENRTSRDARGGAGVIGIAGGEHGVPPWPSFDQTMGVGVYGVSSVGIGVFAEGGAGYPGLSAKGGKGGQGVQAFGDFTGIEATGGAVGIKATSLGDINLSIGSGLNYYGVDAEGKDAGIHAVGTEGPGGIFAVKLSEMHPRAQLRIEPIGMRVPDAIPLADIPFSPTALVPSKVHELPHKGKAGEILVTLEVNAEDPQPAVQHATLWFCTESGGNMGDPSNLAVWREVLLGPPIKGER